MPAVISIMRFRTVTDAGEYSDELEELGFEPQLRRTGSDFAIVVSVPSEDEFEIQEAARVLKEVKFGEREPQVRILSDAEIRQSREKTPQIVEPAPTPRRGEGLEVTPEKREYILQYRQSEAFKRSQKKYQESAAGKEAQSRYAKTQRGKIQRERYQNSEKGKVARQRFQDKQKERRRLLKLHHAGTLTEEEDIRSFEELFGETP